MVSSLRKSMKQTIADVVTMSRDEWLKSHTNQVTLTVEQLVWAREIDEIFDEPDTTPEKRLEGLKEYEQRSIEVSYHSKDSSKKR